MKRNDDREEGGIAPGVCRLPRRGVFAALPVAATADTPKARGTHLHDPGRLAAEFRRATRSTLRRCMRLRRSTALIPIDPANPFSTTDFVCDLCSEMPIRPMAARPITFKIRTASMARRLAADRGDAQPPQRDHVSREGVSAPRPAPT